MKGATCVYTELLCDLYHVVSIVYIRITHLSSMNLHSKISSCFVTVHCVIYHF